MKKRIPAIEYIRGVSMLGVIGIHTGAQYLSNPAANIHLAALLEVFTRFSVPIFFFISAFGLFYRLNLEEKLNYKDFMSRRFRAVLVPYLTWSFLYSAHYTFVYHDYAPWTMLTQYLVFGLASYHLYFLVILLWFYALMPIWIFMLKYMTLPRLGVLLALQIGFDYYSSFLLSPNSSSAFINMLVEYRLNYWVFHYAFIFILGGYAAIHHEAFYQFLKKRYWQIHLYFCLSLAALLWYYYHLIYSKNYSAESAINTAHQLSPAGILYTIGASFFFFAVFSAAKFPPSLHSLLALLGRHSYFAYLFHPFAIHYLALYVAAQGKIMTASVTMIFYTAVVSISVVSAIVTRRLGERLPIVNVLLTGTYPNKQKK